MRRTREPILSISSLSHDRKACSNHHLPSPTNCNSASLVVTCHWIIIILALLSIQGILVTVFLVQRESEGGDFNQDGYRMLAGAWKKKNGGGVQMTVSAMTVSGSGSEKDANSEESVQESWDLEKQGEEEPDIRDVEENHGQQQDQDQDQYQEQDQGQCQNTEIKNRQNSVLDDSQTQQQEQVQKHEDKERDNGKDTTEPQIILPHIAITIYSYDRPRHLLNLLKDIADQANVLKKDFQLLTDSTGEESAVVQQKWIPGSIYVQIIDDNSRGCVYDSRDENIYEKDSRLLNKKIGQTLQDVLEQDSQSSVRCVSDARFQLIKDFVAKHGWKFYSSEFRHGRRRYWHLIAQGNSLLQWVNAKYFFYFPDDIRLSQNFFRRAIERWNSIDDPKKITMMLHMEESRENASCWTDVLPVQVNPLVRKIGWVESGNYMSSFHLPRILRYSFPKIPVSRWINNPPISSGVGSWMSEAFHSKSLGMYQTSQSLIAHVGVNASKMNADVVRGSTHYTIHYVDGEDEYVKLLNAVPSVTASIASKWTRSVSLQAAVNSLSHQVDHLNVYLNDYEFIPEFLRTPWITVVQSQHEREGDLGDRGKFFWSQNMSCDYHLTCDDDIIYPSNYTEVMVGFLRQYQGAVAAGVHGILLKQDMLQGGPSKRKGKGYYASREVLMAFEKLETAKSIHIAGTGTLIYRPRDFPDLSLQDFPLANMADIWFGILCQKQGIPLLSPPRPDRWLVEVGGTFEGSLYQSYTQKQQADQKLTKAVQSQMPWKVIKAERI